MTAALILPTGLSGPGRPASAQPSASDAPRLDLPYAVTLSGVEDKGLLDLLRRSSRLEGQADQPPATRAVLDRRITDDVERLTAVLRSEGYYAGTVDARVDDTATPAQVTLATTPGPRYVLDGYTLTYGDTPSAPGGRGLSALPRDGRAFGYKPGMPARSADVVTIQKALLDALADQARPLAHVADRRAVVDHARRVMTVTLAVDPGAVVRFGEVSITGLTSVRETYVRGLMPFRPGQPFRQSLVETLRTDLVDTGLFTTVAIDRGAVTEDDRLPLALTLAEAAHRSVGAGARYSTSEGPGATVFWEHRNLRGGHETVRVGSTLSAVRHDLTVTGRKPDYGRRHQDLVASGDVRSQSTDAFDERAATAAVGVERRLSKEWRVSAGGSAEYLAISETLPPTTTGLFGVPVAVLYDGSDDLLDPTRGVRLNVRATPYGGVGSDGALAFVRGEVEGSTYWTPFADDGLVVAARARIGTILGETTASVPAPKRFYAGGGGSVRGYGYQLLGPVDQDGDPIGGRSTFDAGLEFRFKVTDTIGIVPFIEGGTVADTSLPLAEGPLRWAAGLGVRYYTPIGPVRADIAVPLDRRPGIDDTFQFYVSLGQAF